MAYHNPFFGDILEIMQSYCCALLLGLTKFWIAWTGMALARLGEGGFGELVHSFSAIIPNSEPTSKMK